MNTRFVKSAGVALLAAVALALSGCASESEETPSANDTTASAPVTQEDCEGVWAVVDFGELGADDADTQDTGACVDTDESITAAEAFEQAGVELGESEAFAGAICRVDGQPAADVELEYEGETRTEDCKSMGPAWAYWGLFIDTGDGWEYAMEGVASQQVEAGQAIALAWQFGDTSAPQLPGE